MAGSFGDWVSGQKITWSTKDQAKMDPAEFKAFKQAMVQVKKLRDAELSKIQAAAAKRAKSIWDKAGPAGDDHPYLEAKGVSSYGLRIKDGALVVPLVDPAGRITTVQRIYPDGKKRYLSNGKKRGSFYTISGEGGAVYLVEGYATGATIAEATGGTVIVCFDTSNLLPAAQAIRKKNPDANLIFCADNDQFTEGNAGVTTAQAATKLVSGLVSVPQFKDISSKPTDFNDLATLDGIDEVRRQIESAAENIIRPVEGVAQAEEAAQAEDQLDFPFEAMVGHAGFFAEVFGDVMEAPKHFLFMAYLTCLGAYFAPFLTVKSVLTTQPRLYTVLVGESSIDRKSTTLNKVVSTFKSAYPDFNTCYGIGSAEGMQRVLKSSEETESAPIIERIGTLLVFDELKAFVSKCKIDNSVLLPIVNSLFEINLYETHTKKRDFKVENAYLSLLAATTKET